MKRARLGAIALAAALTTSLNAQDEAKPAEATTGEVAGATDVAKDEAKPDAEAKPEVKAEPKVLVTVDGVPITDEEVEKRFQVMYGENLKGMPAEQASLMRSHATSNIKEQLISQQLLQAAADAAKIGVDETKKTEMIDGVKESLQEGQTMEDFYKTVGMTADEFIKDVEMRVRFDALLETKTADVKAPSDEETKKFYDDNAQEFVKQEEASARHILIKVDPTAAEGDSAKKRAEIEAIRKQLVDKKGENFADLAKEHSGCPSSAEGGSLGTFGRGDMVKAFEDAAFSQPVGEIGEIIETRFGFHVMQVTDRSDGGKVPFDKVKDRIADYLKRQEEDSVVQNYLDELRENAKIEDHSAPPAPPALDGLVPK